MLKVCGVTKKYAKTYACDNVSFNMNEGTITVLLGPNGAGKSTIMKSMIGFLRYNGEITVDSLQNKSVAAKRLLGYIPEMPALYPNLTVGEHLEFVARAYKLADYKAYADELVERLELSDKLKKFGDELSKGMQQKLSVCIGLLPKPKYILFDEPMIGLDPHAIKELKEIMHDRKAEGCGILVSTHIIDSIDMLWDNAVIMQNGKVMANVDKPYLESYNKTLEDLFFEITERKNSSSEDAK